MIDLQAEWTRLSEALGIEPGHAAQVWTQLAAAYGEPQRHYHTMAHITAVVADWTRVRDRFEAPDSALLALFFHDAVYDPARRDNEVRSADLLRHLLLERIDGEVMKAACWAIWATKSHEPDEIADVNLVLDIDMAILGAPRDAYLHYAEAVAREYLPVYGLDAYAAGRAKLFLEPSLARDRLFLTEPFAGLEAAARANMAEELILWTSGVIAERLKQAL
jgi:predicted metal-dependent HD superfamily phosphohydrolase